eukprot:scaffold824_cov327-Pavlova_lutheri.AAC.43
MAPAPLAGHLVQSKVSLWRGSRHKRFAWCRVTSASVGGDASHPSGPNWCSLARDGSPPGRQSWSWGTDPTITDERNASKGMEPANQRRCNTGGWCWACRVRCGCNMEPSKVKVQLIPKTTTGRTHRYPTAHSNI